MLFLSWLLRLGDRDPGAGRGAGLVSVGLVLVRQGVAEIGNGECEGALRSVWGPVRVPGPG